MTEIETSQTIGEVVRARRLARGHTLTSLSRVSGIDRMVISRLEKDERKGVRADTLLSICRALGDSMRIFDKCKSFSDNELR